MRNTYIKNKGPIFLGALIILAIVGFILKQQHNEPAPVVETPKEEAPKVETTPISITTKDIKETNFTGTRPAIEGSAKIAVAAREYVNNSVAEFKKTADVDVPDMREEFGADAPMASYTIDIDAKHVEGPKTESLVMSTYAYTGGANGNSLYHVITALKSGGKVITLGDVIREDKRSAFVAFAKKELNNWVPNGSDGPVVFAEDVGKLTFSNFSNFSLDDKNLIVYFDKYAIGPGVLGAVAFPLPLSDIKTFLTAGF